MTASAVRPDHHDWQSLRRDNARRGGDLPKSLRWAVRRVHRDDLQQHLVDRVDQEVDVRVFGFEDVGNDALREAFAELGLLASNRRRRGNPLEEDDVDQVDAATRATVLDQLGGDRDFIRHLVRLGNQLLREAHLGHFEPLAARARGNLSCVEPPKSAVWNVMSDLGIGDASVLESLPDEIAIWVAQSILKSVKAGAVLTVGDVASCISKALSLLEPTTKLLVDEVDTSGRPMGPEPYISVFKGRRGRHERAAVKSDRRPSPCVRSRGPSLPTSGSYEVCVVNMPAPAFEGTARMRLHYKEDDHTVQAVPADPGRMSEFGWKAALREYVGRVVGLLKAGGVVVLVLPAAYRAWHAYVDSPALLDGLDIFMGKLGVRLVRRHDIVEIDPPSRPFVGRRTCKRHLIVGRTAA